MDTLILRAISSKTAQALLAIALIIPTIAEARNCVKGKQCGNSCIAQKDVCHIGAVAGTSSAMSSSAADVAPAVAAPARRQAAPQATTESHKMKLRQCGKGKPCGNSCIPATAVCHT